MKNQKPQQQPKPCTHNYKRVPIGKNIYQKCTKCKDVILPTLKEMICKHNWEDVPTAQMLGLKQCVKCGKEEVKG